MPLSGQSRKARRPSGEGAAYGYYDAKDAKEKNAQLRAERQAREQAEAERNERD